MVAAAVIVPMLIDLSMKSRRDDGVDRDRQQRWETHTRRISRRDIMLRLILEHYVVRGLYITGGRAGAG